MKQTFYGSIILGLFRELLKIPNSALCSFAKSAFKREQCLLARALPSGSAFNGVKMLICRKQTPLLSRSQALILAFLGVPFILFGQTLYAQTEFDTLYNYNHEDILLYDDPELGACFYPLLFNDICLIEPQMLSGAIGLYNARKNGATWFNTTGIQNKSRYNNNLYLSNPPVNLHLPAMTHPDRKLLMLQTAVSSATILGGMMYNVQQARKLKK